jgi:hypothetical protein
MVPELQCHVHTNKLSVKKLRAAYIDAIIIIIEAYKIQARLTLYSNINTAVIDHTI